jgi:gliding motility-associated-like protein
MKLNLYVNIFLSIYIFLSIKAYPQYLETPKTIFEIENILVDACAGTVEGQNEMILFQIGKNDIKISDLRIDGAGANGIIQNGKWPNTSNIWRGISNTTRASDIALVNNTITHCGLLKEPVNGILPAGKKILLITSTDWNPLAHSFSSLQDTLYVIFQNSGNTAGHFVNHGTDSERTLRITHLASGYYDQVIYNRAMLQREDGSTGPADGAAVSYTWNGIPTYYNNGCQAPYIPMDASWNFSNTTICESSTSINLNSLITGTPGGTWSGTGVNGTHFSPKGLNGEVVVTYTIGVHPCTLSESHPINVKSSSQPIITVTNPSCEDASKASISNFNSGTNYLFTPNDGIYVDESGKLLNANYSTNYSVVASDGTCYSIPSSTFTIMDKVAIPPQPIITVTNPSCEDAGKASISNFNSATNYLFTPNDGIYVDESGKLLNANYSTNYSVVASDGTCYSIPSSTFTIMDKVAIPPQPIITVTNPSCEDAGKASISNFNSATNYLFTPNDGIYVDESGKLLNANYSTNYSVVASDGTCYSIPSTTFTMKDKLSGVISLNTTQNISALTCKEKTITITANVTGGLPPYSFRINETQWSYNNNFIVDKAGVYQIEVRDKNQCSGHTQVSIQENKPSPMVNVKAIDSVCFPETIDLSNSVTANDNVIIKYFSNHNLSTELSSTIIQGVTNHTYYIAGMDSKTGCIGTPIAATVNINEIQVEHIKDTIVCEKSLLELWIKGIGEQASDYQYDFFLLEDNVSYKQAISNNRYFENIIPSGNSLYFIGVKNGACSYHETIKITSIPYPIIKIEESSIGVKVIVQNETHSPYLYSFNYGEWQNSPWFPKGYDNNYVVTVANTHGCETSVQYSIDEIIDIVPASFFSPNGDGINDTWEIENIDYYPTAVIEIYDRFSKLISRYSGDQRGWDGTYYGNPMPMTDYWYVIALPALGKSRTGHFTLKR